MNRRWTWGIIGQTTLMQKNLREIPSAEDMKADGIEVGEMNVVFLKKIEELTLYVIELQEKGREQDEQIRKLQNK